MSKCHNDQFIATAYDDNVVWETAKDESFCSKSAGVSGHRRKGQKAVFYNIKWQLRSPEQTRRQAPVALARTGWPLLPLLRRLDEEFEPSALLAL